MKRIIMEFIWLLTITASVVWAAQASSYRRELEGFTVVTKAQSDGTYAEAALGR